MTNNDPENKNVAPTQPFDPSNMASLAGLSPSNPAESSLAVTRADEEIEQSKTKLPIYKQSFYKLVTIGGCFLIGCLALGSLIFKEQKQEVATATTPASSPTEKSTEDFRPDPRFGVVNSKLAMEGQNARIIEAAVGQQKLAAETKNAATSNTTAAPVSPPTNPASLAKTTAPASDPQVVTNSNTQPDPIYQAPPPVAIPQSAPPTIAKASQPAPVARIEPPAIAPKPVRVATVTQIAAIRQQPLPRSANSPTAAIVKPAPVAWEVANRNAVGVWGRTGGNETGGTAATATPAPTRIAQANSIDEAVAVVGQQIKARMITPFQISTAVSSQPIFLALAAPILDSRGKVLLPVGSQVMAEVAALDNGMLQVISAKASVNGQLVDLPKQSLVLQDASKQPLIAQVKVFGQGEVFNRDLMSFFGGALQAVGKNLTQPQTQTIATNGGFLQTSNPQQNITGAVLDGGFSPLVSQWMERNKQATTQINSASKIWFLPTGTDVNLIVAQPFSL